MSTDATMTPEMIEAMRPIWEAAYEALRTDVGTLEDLARAAARAAAARDERVAQESAPVPEVRGTCGLCRQSGHNRRSCTASS